MLALNAQASVALRMTGNHKKVLFREKVVEGFYRGEFVVLDVEDGVELGDVEHILNLLGEAKEFELATGVADRGVAADQFAYAGGIDVIDVGQIENDFFLAGGDKGADGVAKVFRFVAKGDASVEIDDGDVADFAGSDVHRVEDFQPNTFAVMVEG